MATTTPNFGWSVPTSTDLVKDGATAIETLGDAIDASMADLKGGTTGQVLKKNSGTDMDFVWSADSAGMTNPMTTTGDTIYSSSGSTPARLGIGTTGQVLTVSGGLPTWATPGAGKNWTLLSTTAMSGSSSVTVSGISNVDDVLVFVKGATFAVTYESFRFRINGDTGSKYSGAYWAFDASSSYATSSYNCYNDYQASYVQLGNTANSTSSQMNAIISINGCKSTGVKTFAYTGGATHASQSLAGFRNGQGYYEASAALSSITIYAGYNFQGGTIYVYGA